MRQIYDYLGGTPQCGRCARSIRRIVEKATANGHLRCEISISSDPSMRGSWGIDVTNA
jgi:hypothetical protein